MSLLLWLLLPVAAYSGWVAASRHLKSTLMSQSPANRDQTHDSAKETPIKLIDTQPDKAVDTVIDKLEVTPETVEVHLALGNLYRKNGEVNRAIRFHQNLTEKHALSISQRESILFELAKDYFAAGLLDRAERIFKDLLTTSEFQIISSKSLIDVYQQEKEWDLALEYAELYEELSGKTQKNRISHYYCEKAEKTTELESKLTLLKLSLKKNKGCVRANILLGNFFFDQCKYETALQYYLGVIEQDKMFLAVVFDKITQCFQLVLQEKNVSPVLPGASSSTVVATPDNSQDVDSELRLANHKKSIRFAEQHLRKVPTLALLRQYVMLALDDVQLMERNQITEIKDALFHINKINASFRCSTCGIELHALHWQCPSCSTWSSIRPV